MPAPLGNILQATFELPNAFGLGNMELVDDGEPADQFPFLQLPWRARKRVYTLLLEECFDVRLIPPRFVSDRKQLESPSDRWYWRHLKRNFLGLTQVCQQLRFEFLPFYYRHVTFRVAGHHVDESIAELFASLGNGRASLSIEACTANESVNLIPLMRLKDSIPNLSISLHTTSIRQSVDLNKLLNDKTNQKWNNYIRSHGAGVWFETGHDIPLVKIRAPTTDTRMLASLIGLEKYPEDHKVPNKWLGKIQLGSGFIVLRVEIVPQSNRYLLGDEELA